MRIKEQPDDFVVEELRTLHPTSTGKYLYYLLQKRNLTTFEAITTVAARLHLPVSVIGYAGNKDKLAVTSQYISLPFQPRQHLQQEYTFSKITLTYATHADERINLGDLDGNLFTIVVRDLSKKQTLHIDKIINFFDAQRFGVDKNNALIGKALLQGRFAEACQLLHLPVAGNNSISALRTLNRKILRFYIHSYQSYLWNTLALRLSSLPEKLPLIGYLTKPDVSYQEVYDSLLQEEGITPHDFLLRKMPELASEGGERKTFVPVHDFTSAWENDPSHPGKFCVTLRFRLDKGVYATQVVKQLFSKSL